MIAVPFPTIWIPKPRIPTWRDIASYVKLQRDPTTGKINRDPATGKMIRTLADELCCCAGEGCPPCSRCSADRTPCEWEVTLEDIVGCPCDGDVISCSGSACITCPPGTVARSAAVVGASTDVTKTLTQTADSCIWSWRGAYTALQLRYYSGLNCTGSVICQSDEMSIVLNKLSATLFNLSMNLHFTSCACTTAGSYVLFTKSVTVSSNVCDTTLNFTSNAVGGCGDCVTQYCGGDHHIGDTTGSAVATPLAA